MRYVVVFISILLVMLMAAFGTAQLIFERAKETRNMTLLQTAQKINPFSSEFFYEEYVLTSDRKALRKAMDLEPTKPAYHMYYGLALVKLSPRTLAGDQEAVREVCRAAMLKPYSSLYRETCDKFTAVIPLD